MNIEVITTTSDSYLRTEDLRDKGAALYQKLGRQLQCH